MTTAQHLSIAWSALIISASAWATEGVADDQTTGIESRGAQSAPTATPTPGTVRSAPSTYRTEGTAADRTIPGATRTRVTEPGTANPLPATSRAEGTAADRSPPGETPVRGTAATRAPKQATSRIARSDAPAVATTEAAHAMRTTNLIGMTVQDRQGMSVGSVEDVVVDAAEGRITYALVGLTDSRGDAPAFVAIPWNTFARMMGDDGVVVERSTIASAPQITQSELRQIDRDSWRDAADRYWDRSKSAQAEPTR